MRTLFHANDTFVSHLRAARAVALHPAVASGAAIRREPRRAAPATRYDPCFQTHNACIRPSAAGPAPVCDLPIQTRPNAPMTVEATWYLIIGGLLIAMALARKLIAHLPM